jgi:outer membrane protein assembly complex protein YaeT
MAALSLALLLASPGNAADNLQGLPVTQIVFSPPAQPIPAARLQPLIAVHEGAPLDPESVRRSIQQMFSTGRYSDIQVDAVRAGDGVRVTFITTESWFIGPVRVVNVKAPPTPGQLVAATNLILGEPYSEEKLNAATETLRRVLEENGFYHASIDAETNAHSDTQQIDITFQVESGPRARFGEIRLIGKPELTPDEVRRICKWSTESHVTQPAVQRGIGRLGKYYQRTDHLEATVRLAERKFAPGSDRVDFTLELVPGPRVEVDISGAKLSQKELRRYVPIYQEGAVRRDLLAEGARNLRDFFQTEGYFEAKVDYDQQPEQNGVILVEFQAALGPLHHFAKLDITGNHYFDLATIRERMFLQPNSIQLHRGRFSQSLLRSDIAAIEELYRSNGFPGVKIDSQVLDDYQGKKGDVAAVLKIDEGPQTLVSRLTITGNRAIPMATLLARVTSLEGQPFSDVSVASDRDQILAYYFDEGFKDASLEWRSAPAAQPNRVDLEYTIHEGERQFVDRVTVEGNRTTRDAVIEQQIDVYPGEALSQGAIIDSQRRLYDLGVFAVVETGVQNPDGDEQARNVLFDLEEARRWTVGFGGGAEIGRIGGNFNSLDAPAGATGFSPRVSLEVNRLNMFGKANTLSFQSRFSNFEKRGVVNYLAPNWHGKERLTLTESLLVDNSRDVRTFAATRLEGAVQLQHKISKPSSLFYRFTYRRVTVGSLKINPVIIPVLSQADRVGLLSASFYQDRRDDPVDARRGIYNSVDLGTASYYTGSVTTYARLLMQDSTYHPIGRKLVLARTTQFGALVPYGRPRQVENPDGTISFTHEIPLPERFFSGGSNSNRAFPINQAGPRDSVTGFPVGGNGLFLNSVELRFPLKGQNIGGVLFHDMGNVFDQPQNIRFRFHQRNDQDFNYMVHAAGFGVRYRTPIGPIRFDLAYDFNPPRFRGFNGTVQDLINIGTRPIPPERITGQRISQFQFHFSLGQAF